MSQEVFDEFLNKTEEEIWAIIEKFSNLLEINYIRNLIVEFLTSRAIFFLFILMLYQI